MFKQLRYLRLLEFKDGIIKKNLPYKGEKKYNHDDYLSQKGHP